MTTERGPYAAPGQPERERLLARLDGAGVESVARALLAR